MPKISVVMPVYNGEKFLREAIDSILNQTFSDFEFIIINDCSTDETEQIIKSYDDKRIVYVKNDNNMGVAASLNRGFDLAKGEYIARMDADDISLPQRFKAQTEFMDNNPDIAVCGCETELFGDTDKKDTYTVFGRENMKINLLFSSCLCHPAVMLRRSVIEKEHYRYDNYFDKLEDYELWTRIILKYDFDNIHGVYFRYRIHGKQVTQNYSEEHRIKSKEIRKRLLDSIGVECTDCELETYSDYCLGKEYYDILSLAAVFEKIVKINKNTSFFDDKILTAYFRGALLNAVSKDSGTSVNQIINACGFIRHKDAAFNNMKHIVKKIIRR